MGQRNLAPFLFYLCAWAGRVWAARPEFKYISKLHNFIFNSLCILPIAILPIMWYNTDVLRDRAHPPQEPDAQIGMNHAGNNWVEFP